jgi:class 3 adenylate cyclase
VIIVATIYWLSLMLTVGPMQGLEYFLAGLMVLPVLILSRAQTGQRLLSVGFIVGVFALTILLTRGKGAPPILEEQTLAIGYHVNGLILAGVIFASVSYYKRFAATSYGMLSSKKRQNEALVSRLVPSGVASEMANQNSAAAQWHPEGTIMVGVVTGFSELYARLPAIELVAELDTLYSRFDELIESRGVEKVKTLGTSYVAAACVRDARGDHAAIAESALSMRDIVEDFAREHDLPIGFRCGIATGLTISGVLGKSRPRFDVWGEALDAATTLQAAACDGEILANETIFWRLKDAFRFAGHDGHGGAHALVSRVERNELTP